jgi:hypothetical protein
MIMTWDNLSEGAQCLLSNIKPPLHHSKDPEDVVDLIRGQGGVGVSAAAEALLFVVQYVPRQATVSHVSKRKR